MKTSILTLLFLLPILLNPNDFQEGNKLFSSDEYEEAEEFYKKDILNRGESFNTYYNLASLNIYRENKGLAIYYLNKARNISPRDKDLNELLIQLDMDRNITSNRELTITIIVISYIFSLSLLTLVILNYKGILTIKKSIHILLPQVVIILGLSISILFGFKIKDRGITIENSPVLISPYSESEISFNIEEGLEIEVNEVFENYIYITDSENRFGWIDKKSIGMLWKKLP